LLGYSNLNSRPLLRNGSINTFPQQLKLKDITVTTGCSSAGFAVAYSLRISNALNNQ
jgi:hypothetical protein